MTTDQRLLIALIVVISALPFLLGDQQSSLLSATQIGITSTDGDAAKQFILASVYGASVFLLVLRTNFVQALRALGLPLLLLVVLCFASSMWSELPSLVLRRSVALAGTIGVGLYAGTRVDEEELTEILIRSAVLLISSSLVVAVLWPMSGLDPEGRLRGVFAHKNSLGAFAALGLFAVLARFSLQETQSARHLQFFAALLSLVALILSGSASPLPVLACGALVLLTARKVVARGTLAPALLIAILVAGVLLPLFATDLAAVAAVFGRDPEFSGRTRVWLFSLELLQRDPWLGYGYGAFWNGPEGMIFLRWTGFPVPHAHNGFLQLALDTGLVGLLLFLASVLVFLIRLSQGSAIGGERGWAFAAGLFAYFLAGNLTESRLMAGNELMTILFVYMVVRASTRSQSAVACVVPIDGRSVHAPPAHRTGP